MPQNILLRFMMRDIIIRNIEEKDYYEVEYLAKKAFWNINMPGCDEHYLVHRLWKESVYVPEISMLAELDGKVVGAILYAKAKIETDKGMVETLTFGPLCVEPEMQREGIGGAILAESMKKAKEYGYTSILLCGVPAYYPRFGFVTADKYRITMPDGSNFDAFMAIELQKGSLSDVSGRFFEPDVYSGDICNAEYMQEVDKFDEGFPYMEKVVLPTQWRMHY